VKTVYLVKSGQYDANIGTTDWLNLRAFTDSEKAHAWVESEIKRDPSFNENFDSYQIEDITVYD